ncbi:MAG: hypothetical protein WCF95_03865 [bacterium]
MKQEYNIVLVIVLAFLFFQFVWRYEYKVLYAPAGLPFGMVKIDKLTGKTTFQPLINKKEK